MGWLLKNLDGSEIVSFPTDTTNSFIGMREKKCITIVKEHPIQSARYMDREKLREIFEDTKLLMYAVVFIMSKMK